jgi:hypothetical protein
MYGNELLDKDDSGLEFGELLDGTIYPNARFEAQMG